MNKKTLNSLLLLLSAIIWGVAVVFQSTGMEYIGSFTFSAVRSLIGSFAIGILFLSKRFRNLIYKESSGVIDKAFTRKAGLVNGVILFFAMNAQQYGLLFTTPGKTAFITSLYVVIIPIILTFMGKKLSNRIKVCIFFAVIGMYLLSVNEDFSIGIGDLIVFLSANLYAIHILSLTHYSPKSDSLKLNSYQFLVCGILSLISAFIFEDINIYNIYLARKSILYVGIMSSAIAYTFQVVALKEVDPTIASLINSTEGVFGALGGFLILHQALSSRELLGCIIMFIATIMAQISIPKFTWRRKYE